MTFPLTSYSISCLLALQRRAESGLIVERVEPGHLEYRSTTCFDDGFHSRVAQSNFLSEDKGLCLASVHSLQSLAQTKENKEN